MKEKEKSSELLEYPSLGLIVKYFKLCLYWAPTRTQQGTIIYYSSLFMITALFFNQMINVIILRETSVFLIFLQNSAFHMGLVKFIAFEFYHKQWEQIIGVLSTMEREQMENIVYKNILKRYIKYGRIVTCSFWFLCVAIHLAIYPKVCLNIILDLETSNFYGIREKFFHLWWPKLDGRLSVYSYMIIQYLYGTITSLYIVGWDVMCTVIMISFSGQLQVVGTRFRLTLNANTCKDQRRSLIDCYKQYVHLVETQKQFQTILSPPLFVHLLIASINISIMIIHMSEYDKAQAMGAILLLIGLFSQMYMYYWHGDEVSYQSELIRYALFESAWVDKDADIRKLVCLISMFTSKRLVFHAGPFNEVSLATFVSMLRVTYSFYTLMAKSR